MKKGYMFLIILLSCSMLACSCALLRQPLDKASGFSGYLKQTEAEIRSARWTAAMESLNKSIRAWYQVKPYLQIDIDHDYINEIEADFIRLRSGIETRSIPDSLVSVLLIQDNWRDIGSM